MSFNSKTDDVTITPTNRGSNMDDSSKSKASTLPSVIPGFFSGDSTKISPISFNRKITGARKENQEKLSLLKSFTSVIVKQEVGNLSPSLPSFQLKQHSFHDPSTTLAPLKSKLHIETESKEKMDTNHNQLNALCSSVGATTNTATTLTTTTTTITNSNSNNVNLDNTRGCHLTEKDFKISPPPPTTKLTTIITSNPSDNAHKRRKTKKVPVENVADMIPLLHPSSEEVNQSSGSTGATTTSINKRARSNNFTVAETNDLLKIWTDPQKHGQQNYNSRSFRSWDAVASWMRKMGHERNALQCKNRIQNLTSTYYKVKKVKEEGNSTFNFPYYEVLRKILKGNGTGNDEEKLDNTVTPSSLTTPTGNDDGQNTNLISPLASLRSLTCTGNGSFTNGAITISSTNATSSIEMPVSARSNNGGTFQMKNELQSLGTSKASSAKNNKLMNKGHFSKLPSNRNQTTQMKVATMKTSPTTTPTTTKKNSVIITPIFDRNRIYSSSISGSKIPSSTVPISNPIIKTEPRYEFEEEEDADGDDEDDTPELSNRSPIYNVPIGLRGEKSYFNLPTSQSHYRDTRPSMKSNQVTDHNRRKRKQTAVPGSINSKTFSTYGMYPDFSFESSYYPFVHGASSTRGFPRAKRQRTNSETTDTSTMSDDISMENEILKLRRASLDVEREMLKVAKEKVEVEKARVMTAIETGESHQLYFVAIMNLLQQILSDRRQNPQ